MAESLRTHAENLADYLSQTVLDHDELSIADILDALASLDITLVEDPVSDSTHTYYEALSGSDAEPKEDGGDETPA